MVSSELLQNWVNSCLHPHSKCFQLSLTHTASTATYPCTDNWPGSSSGRHVTQGMEHRAPSNKALWDVEGHGIPARVSNTLHQYMCVSVCVGRRRNKTSVLPDSALAAASVSTPPPPSMSHASCSGSLLCRDTVMK